MEVLRQISAVVIVFGLLGVAVWALRRRAGPLRFGPSKSLASVERLALTPQHAVHLIHIAGRELLIATHPNGLTLLTENKLPLPEIKSSDLPTAALRMERQA
jgi:flagellar biogenesis protein FliO